ncbi:hypothetical protein [Paracoccus yeei]|uniref:hypothetical protein n=1 Tax=Paracoccus yeei TaxID=147645 RepID=UPI003BF7A876
MANERAQVEAARARTGYMGSIPHAGEALRMAQRHGDFSGIRLRLQLGIPLSPEELDALELLDRGAPAKRGPKDPSTAFETVISWRWLVERAGWSGPDAYSLLAEMMDKTPGAIKARVTSAQGLGKNIADHCFDVHADQDVSPALLRHRSVGGRCLTCRKVRCKCDPPPRPAFEETSEGAVITALLSFWRGRWAVSPYNPENNQ